MKKVMIGILILIPLVVLLVVGLVTTFVSVNAYIGVESVHLDKHELTIELQTVYKLDGDGGVFEVKVLPEMAFDRSYEWTIENVRSRDADYPDEKNGENGFYYVELIDANGNHVDSMGSGARLRANVHCNFELKVTAATYTDTCSVVVGGDVTAVTLDGEMTLKVGEQKSVVPRFTPLDGTVDSWEWIVTGGDANVVTLDRNGFVTGAKEGEVTLRYKAINGSGEEVLSNEMTITVSASASAYGDIIGTHRSRFALSEIGVDAADVAECFGCSVTGGNFSFDEGEERAAIEFKNEEVLIINLVGENDIEIVERGIVLGTDEYALAVNGEPLYLTARYASVFKRGESVEVTWSSSDEEVATVDADGVVRGLSSGEVTVTAQTAAGDTATLEFPVQRKVAVLVGAVTDASLKVGMARETIFPSMKYDNGKIVANTFSVGVLYPSMFEGEDEASFYEAFEFTSDHPELISFGGEGRLSNELVFNYAAITEYLERGETEDIVVTVKAKHPKYANLPEYTTASFTMTVADAIGVTSDPELRQAQQTDRKATVLLNDIHMENNSNKDAEGNFTKTSNIYTYNNVYGNGFTIEAEKDQFIGKTEPFFQVYADDVLISNLTMRPNAFSDEEIEGGDLTINDASTFSTGYCIKYNVSARRRTTGEGDEVTQTKGARIEYCLMENAATLIQLSGAEVEIEGCIMRNTGGVAIHVRNVRENAGNNVTLQHYNNLTMTNCVMSNMVGTAINFDYNNNYYVEDATTRSTFTQKGFLDIYNWQPSDSLTLIPSDTLEEVKLPEGLQGLLFGFIQNAFDTEPFIESYRRSYLGQNQMHLGFISLGLAGPTRINDGYLPDGRRVLEDGTIEGTDEKADPDQVSWNITLEDKRFKRFTSNDIKSIKDLAGLLSGALDFVENLLNNPLNVWSYDDDTTDLVPGVTYTVNARLVDRLHGIGV